jgi:hypothetical protein
VRLEVPGNDPQQRSLAGSVRADERNLGSLPDPKGDVVEQHATIGKLEPDTGNLYVTHSAPV